MGIFKCHTACLWTLLLAVLLAVVPRFGEIGASAGAASPFVPPPAPPPRPLEFVNGTFERNGTLSTTLAAFQVPPEVALRVIEAVRPVFDVRRFRPGQPFQIVRNHQGGLEAFEYTIDAESFLRVEPAEDGFQARIEQLPLDTFPETISASVDSSLWGAVSGFPRGDWLVMELVDIFGSQVDFYRDIRPGDRIRFVVDAQYYRGEFVKYGQVRAAEFVNQGRAFQAYRYGEEYYDQNGMSTRRSFLPAPLEFTRISSGFSNARLHPILNTVRAHRGVDYAAPTGTPVWAAADGRVTFAGTNGGYGRMVRLEHPNGVITEYAHLSRILVGTGDRVRQKDVIGRVGMTGTATGPHLHYQLMMDGRYVNPRAVRLDPPRPIDPDLRADYLASIVPLQSALAGVDEAVVQLAEE